MFFPPLATSPTRRPPTTGEQGIPPSYSPRDVLALALSQGVLDELPAHLTRAAYDPNTPVQGLAQLMAALERVGVDFSGARAALASAVTRHCARCHRAYRDRENGPRACVVYHEAADARWDRGGADASRISSCACQGIAATLDAALEKGECYRGWHTDDRAQVDYVSSSAVPCEDNDCWTVKLGLRGV
ncbi:hypothetical protein DAEQUDRAFT_736868 [Daedalea quercina L-15889]|uniref:Uncharacterized protein n=1 Tax=Daedalea quercina L-15889 TaxID=1314783 RepID=A0A165S0F5_9APHY|nr:hypothetical protein DAEQUDRAFT_736868 [Daedalea quercina L-15889]